jgi:hypothetical protein
MTGQKRLGVLGLVLVLAVVGLSLLWRREHQHGQRVDQQLAKERWRKKHYCDTKVMTICSSRRQLTNLEHQRYVECDPVSIERHGKHPFLGATPMGHFNQEPGAMALRLRTLLEYCVPAKADELTERFEAARGLDQILAALDAIVDSFPDPPQICRERTTARRSPPGKRDDPCGERAPTPHVDNRRIR